MLGHADIAPHEAIKHSGEPIRQDCDRKEHPARAVHGLYDDQLWFQLCRRVRRTFLRAFLYLGSHDYFVHVQLVSFMF